MWFFEGFRDFEKELKPLPTISTERRGLKKLGRKLERETQRLVNQAYANTLTPQQKWDAVRNSASEYTATRMRIVEKYAQLRGIDHCSLVGDSSVEAFFDDLFSKVLQCHYEGQEVISGCAILDKVEDLFKVSLGRGVAIWPGFSRPLTDVREHLQLYGVSLPAEVIARYCPDAAATSSPVAVVFAAPMPAVEQSWGDEEVQVQEEHSVSPGAPAPLPL